MKVIWEAKKGHVIVVCYECGSELEITKEDLKKSECHRDQVFVCPVCGTECPIDIDAERILNR